MLGWCGSITVGKSEKDYSNTRLNNSSTLEVFVSFGIGNLDVIASKYSQFIFCFYYFFKLGNEALFLLLFDF